MYKTLIIDDENPVQIAISKLGKWSKYGLELPVIASNGKEGLRIMREILPQIIFVDMQMPILNGIEFLKCAIKDFPDSKYIVISGYDEFSYAQSAIKYGAIDYLLKPIVADELNNAIQKAVLQLNPLFDLEANAGNDTSISPDDVVEIIKDYIDKNYSQNIKISMFSDKYFFSKEYLSKLFKAKYSYGIYEYVLKIRMERAAELLRDDTIKIQDISERLGYTDNNYFSKAFRNYYGVTPSHFRNEKKL